MHAVKIMGMGWLSLRRLVIWPLLASPPPGGDPDPKLVAKHRKGSIAADISRPPSARRSARFGHTVSLVGLLGGCGVGRL
jgi:hypothetical protein